MASPRHKVFAELRYEQADWSANIGMQSVAGLYGADSATKALADYTLLQARVTWHATDALSIHLAGENLTDVAYQTMWDYPMPGRTVQAGFRWEVR